MFEKPLVEKEKEAKLIVEQFTQTIGLNNKELEDKELEDIAEKE